MGSKEIDSFQQYNDVIKDPGTLHIPPHRVPCPSIIRLVAWLELADTVSDITSLHNNSKDWKKASHIYLYFLNWKV